MTKNSTSGRFIEQVGRFELRKDDSAKSDSRKFDFEKNQTFEER